MASRYEEAVAQHEWHVPERYNIAADVCDKHPRDKLAMIWERFDGERRELNWGELQDLANQAANVLRDARRRDGRPRRGRAAADARDRGDLLRHLEERGRSCCRCRCSTATTASATASTTRDPRVLVTDEANRGRFDRLGRRGADARRRLLDGASTEFETADTAADDPAQLYYTSGTTGLAKGIVHAHRYILAHEEFVYCHEVQDGERFHGMGEWAWAAGIAPLLGPWRFGAVQVVLQRKGGFDPHAAARLPLAPRGHERLHDAHRDALDDGDRGRRGRATRRGSASSARPASR